MPRIKRIKKRGQDVDVGWAMPTKNIGKTWLAGTARPTFYLCALCCLLSLCYSSTALADEFTVIMKDWEFKPAELAIKAGDTVVWVNDEEDKHNVIFEDTSIKSSETIKQDGKFSITFDKIGKYKYYCRFHRDNGMRGKIIIE